MLLTRYCLTLLNVTYRCCKHVSSGILSFTGSQALDVGHTTCLENLEMLGNFAVVREMSGNWPFVRELSGECQGKILSGKTIVFNEQASGSWWNTVLLDINCVL